VTSRRDDAGFSTVFGLAVAMVFLVVAGAVGALGTLSVVRHRAEATADLAALAAAKHALEGSQAACGAARRLAEEQGATLVECGLDGLDAVVVVAVVPPGRLGGLGALRGRARAGTR
jgi:secretion/DNA translocation related TadE-like protein